jgi:hypothetical protein
MIAIFPGPSDWRIARQTEYDLSRIDPLAIYRHIGPRHRSGHSRLTGSMQSKPGGVVAFHTPTTYSPLGLMQKNRSGTGKQ